MNTIPILGNYLDNCIDSSIEYIQKHIVDDDYLFAIKYINGGVQLTTDPVQILLSERSNKIAIRSEKISGCGGEILLRSAIATCLDIRKLSRVENLNIEKISKNFNIFLSDLKSFLIKNGSEIHSDDINNIIEDLSKKDKTISDIISSTLELTEGKRKIFVEKSLFKKTSIEVIEGCFFKSPVNPEFFGKKDSWKRSDVNCVVVDGFIESVSEIHHILTAASNEKEPYVIFARNFSNDVLHTILMNIKRGTLDVIPVKCPLEEHTANLLGDIAIATGCQIIASDLGQTISSAIQNPDNIKKVKNITIDQKNISIESGSADVLDSIDRKIKTLVEKRKKAENDIEISIIDKRIRSLSSGRIFVRIGTSLISENPKAIEIIDRIFRTISSTYISGSVEVSKLLDFLKIDRTDYNLSKNIASAIGNAGFNKNIPVKSVYYSSKIGISCILAINSPGCILALDDYR